MRSTKAWKLGQSFRVPLCYAFGDLAESLPVPGLGRKRLRIQVLELSFLGHDVMLRLLNWFLPEFLQGLL